ncbi:MAG: hypothetical protein EPN24_03220 [Candidatus Methanoperedens sp.]|nr:MAG: hypothetical protein EPN24_03220 [Candidatus Methanoperedens sp.]
MARLERHGDSYVLVTGSSQKLDIDLLISALSELQKSSPDSAKIREGLLYLDNCGLADFRKEIKTVLQNAIDSRSMNNIDL